MDIKIFFNNIVWSVLNHFMGRGTLMLVSFLLASNLTVSDFSVYSYFLMTVTMISNYSAVGLGVAASKFFAENREHVNIYFLGNTFSLSLFFSIVGCLISYFILDFDVDKELLALAVLVTALNVVPSGALLGLEQYKKVAISSFVCSIVLLAGVFYSIFQKDVLYSIYAYIISTFLLFVYQVYLMHKTTNILGSYSYLIWKKKEVSDILGVSKYFLFISLLSAVAPWLLGRLILSEDGDLFFAVYTIGLQWFALICFLPGMISRVILPYLVKRRDNLKELGDELNKVLMLSFLITIVIAISAILILKYMLPFYGEQYARYYSLIVIFILSSIFYAPVNILGNAIVVKLGERVWFIITLIWFVFLVCGNLFLFNYYNSLVAVSYMHCFAGLLYVTISVYVCKKIGVLK